MNFKAILILFFTVLLGLANADVPTVLSDLKTVGEDLKSLDQAIKATDDRFRTLLAVIYYEGVLETDIQVATFHVRDSPHFNDPDSKTVTDAAMQMKLAIQGYLKDVIAKKSVFEHLSYHGNILANIRFLQTNANRLGEALQDKVNPENSKAIKQCCDQVNESFAEAISALDPVEWIARA